MKDARLYGEHQPLGRELLEIRRSLLAAKPAFLRGVLATAIGPKISDRTFTPEPCLQFVLRKKLPASEVPQGGLIPSRIDGFATDVHRASGELEIPDTLVPSGEKAVGFGARVSRPDGIFGTAAIGARDADGQEVLLTAAHVARNGDVLHLGGPGGPRIGQVKRRATSAWGIDFYGAQAANANERISVDLAVIALDPGVTLRPGLPGGRSLKLESSTLRLIAGLEDSRVVSFGAGTGGWLEGTVTGLWPRRPLGKATGLCKVQHRPRSVGGNSGSLWITYRNGAFVAVGTHWGLVGNYAFLSDVTTGVGFMGLARIL